MAFPIKKSGRPKYTQPNEGTFSPHESSCRADWEDAAPILSYTEFTDQLLQGYDFLYLFQNEGVNVQIGESDQWGNITAGTEMIGRILRAEGAYVLNLSSSAHERRNQVREVRGWINLALPIHAVPLQILPALILGARL